jgi:glycosyltransferase involved in cell wall biosynthesis
MRILIATSPQAVVGGVEKYLQWLIPALQQRGHSIGVLYEDPAPAGVEKIDAVSAGAPGWCAAELGLESVGAALRNWKPDVVYSHGLNDPALERFLLDSFPVALYAHTYRGTCISGRKCHTRPRLQPCSRQLGPGCLAVYHVLGCGGLHPGTAWRLFQLQLARKRTLPRYGAVLVASHHMYQEYSVHGVAPDRLHLVPLFSTDTVPQSSAPPPKAPGTNVLFVGRLVDVKGAAYLLRALPLAAASLGRPLRLTIAGDGPEREKMDALARHLGVQVDFAGWVDGEQRSRLMRQADLLAVPSLWPEPFGLVGIEAGCFGVPAVGFAVGGISDWLLPGRTGELAPSNPPSVPGLAEAIVRALADPSHYQSLREGAWEMSKRHSIERHIAQLEPILERQRADWMADHSETEALSSTGA